MRLMILIALVVMITGMMGCAGMHEKIEDASKPVGSVAAIPQSVGQGVAQGYVHTDDQPNPYNR